MWPVFQRVWCPHETPKGPHTLHREDPLCSVQRDLSQQRWGAKRSDCIASAAVLHWWVSEEIVSYWQDCICSGVEDHVAAEVAQQEVVVVNHEPEEQMVEAQTAVVSVVEPGSQEVLHQVHFTMEVDGTTQEQQVIVFAKYCLTHSCHNGCKIVEFFSGWYQYSESVYWWYYVVVVLDMIIIQQLNDNINKRETQLLNVNEFFLNVDTVN